MISKVGEPRQDVLKSGTYSSVTLNMHMFHTTANTAFVAADFKPESVTVKVIHKTKTGIRTIMNDNLLVLGTYNALRGGLHYFIRGFDRIYPASGVKQYKQRVVTLRFGGCHRVDQGEEILVEVTPAVGCYSSNVDTSLSYVEFYANADIGYEAGYFQTRAEVVQPTTSNQSYSPGDNVTKLAFLNFDKDNLTDMVITTLGLSSDKLDMQLTDGKILAHIAAQENQTNWRYAGIPPTESVFRMADQLPQSFIIFDGEWPKNKDLDQTRLDISFNSANVVASKNWVVWTSYEATQEQVAKAVRREEKHMAEKVAKLPEKIK